MLGGEGINFGEGDAFFGRKRRKEIDGGLGEKGFTGAGGAKKEEIVVTGDGDGKGAFGKILAVNLIKFGGLGEDFRWFYLCCGIFYNTLGSGEVVVGGGGMS